jgi:hypothetical protein
LDYFLELAARSSNSPEPALSPERTRMEVERDPLYLKGVGIKWKHDHSHLPLDEQLRELAAQKVRIAAAHDAFLDKLDPCTHRLRIELGAEELPGTQLRPVWEG